MAYDYNFETAKKIKEGARMPGIASAIDIGKNIGSAANFGFELGSYAMGYGYNASKYTRPFHGHPGKGWSVGGTLSMGGLAIPGGIAGAGAMMLTETGNPLIGAGIGVAAGIAAPVALGMGASAIGHAAVNMATATASSVGSGGMASAAGGIGIGMAKLAGSMINGTQGAMLEGGLGTVLSPVRRHANALKNFGRSLIDFEADAESLGAVKLTNIASGAKAGFLKGLEAESKLGKVVGSTVGGVRGAVFNGHTVLAAATAIKGAKAGFNEMNKIHMGQMDGQITRATPQIPAYSNNAGADGDLVFALNKSRRG